MLRLTKLMALTGLLIAPLFSHAKADEEFLESAELKCVADGVEIATGPGGSLGLRPSEKYLALLGFAVAQSSSASSMEGGLSRELYLERVIQILQADGFCIANKLDGGGAATTQVGYGDIIRNKSNPASPFLFSAVSETKDKGQKGGAKQRKEVVKYFGFQTEDDILNLFTHQNWSSLEPDARQKLFSENVERPTPKTPENRTSLKEMYTPDENGEGLKDCFSQMLLMQDKQTLFNFKKFLKGRRSDGRVFCETIATECNLSSKGFCAVSTSAIKAKGNGVNPPGSTGAPSILDKVRGNPVAQ